MPSEAIDNSRADFELLLDLQQLCPVITVRYDPDLLENDAVYMTAVRLLRWALMESFSGVVPNRRILRERFTAVWKSTYYPEVGKIAPADHPEFWKGPRMAAGIASRIHNFLTKYQVIHPEQPYSIQGMGGNSGKYALIRKKTSTQYYVLCYHRNRPISAPAPVVSEITRYTHALQNPVLMKQDSKATLGTYHLVLMRGESWKNDTVNKELAYKMQANAQSWHNLPSPGGHCKRCVLKDCLKLWIK